MCGQQVEKPTTEWNMVETKRWSKDSWTYRRRKKDEEDVLENILDPLSKTHKGRPRKIRIKPASRWNKKKSEHEGNVPVNIASQKLAGVVGQLMEATNLGERL